MAAIRCELLQHDLALLETVQALITQLEHRLANLVAQTPYQVWTKLKGLSLAQLPSVTLPTTPMPPKSSAAPASSVAATTLATANAGASSRPAMSISAALMNAVATLLLHQPALLRYSKRLQITQHPGVARVATARKTIGILWTMLRDQSSNTLIACKGAEM